MNHKITVLAFAASIVVSVLNSCTSGITPDPIYTRNYAAIQDVDYTANKIVGQWGQFGRDGWVRQDGGQTTVDKRCYLFISPDGTGKVEEFVKYSNKATPTVVEAAFTWAYIGKNRWVIDEPPQTARIFSVTEGAPISATWQGRKSEYRYHQGRLYPKDCPNTFVPLTDEAVRQQLAHIRGLGR